jgi:hypothetical protein
MSEADGHGSVHERGGQTRKQAYWSMGRLQQGQVHVRQVRGVSSAFGLTASERSCLKGAKWPVSEMHSHIMNEINRCINLIGCESARWMRVTGSGQCLR